MDQAVIDRMRSLETPDGRLSPDAVIEDARDPTSPLHNYFDWDTKVLVEKQLHAQARALIRSVRVMVHRKEPLKKTVAYVADPGKPTDRQYVSTARLRTDHELAIEALYAELKRVEGALNRAYDVAYAADLTSEVAALRDRVQSLLSSSAA